MNSAELILFVWSLIGEQDHFRYFTPIPNLEHLVISLTVMKK